MNAYSLPGKEGKEEQRQIAVRIEADVLAWHKSRGKGYHSRLNDILRSAMVEEFKSSSERICALGAAPQPKMFSRSERQFSRLEKSVNLPGLVSSPLPGAAFPDGDG